MNELIKTEKHEVHAWAVMADEKTIVSFLDTTIPDLVGVCNSYKAKGFFVVKLFGEVEIPEETVTITRSEAEKIAESLTINKSAKNIVLEMLGFKKGLV